jgi:hypothetical protein
VADVKFSVGFLGEFDRTFEGSLGSFRKISGHYDAGKGGHETIPYADFP